MKRRSFHLFLFGLCTLGFSLVFQSSAWAQTGNTEGPIARPLVLLLALATISMVPFIAVMFTSFVKIVVVLSLVRTSLGTQQVPPNQVITGMALVLTIYVMTPIGLQIKRDVQSIVEKKTGRPLLSNASVDLVMQAVEKGREPLRQFLIRNAHDKERALFYQLAYKMYQPEDRETLSDKDFSVVLPAFIVSELTEAFQIGFIIFLPFLVIDMVVANILLSLGMFQLSPVTVSLPFKILLFVLVDGWFLITRGLILGYV